MALAAEQARRATPGAWRGLEVASAASRETGEVLERLASAPDGLSSAEAARRLDAVGPNALRTHGARPLVIFARQLRNPLLILLVTTAVVSAFVGEGTDAAIILGIICL